MLVSDRAKEEINHRGTECTEKKTGETNDRDTSTTPHDDALTRGIIGAAIEVHRFFGPGLLESIYEKALSHELRLRDIAVVCQYQVPVTYKGSPLGDFRIDMLVCEEVIVELKVVDSLAPIHVAQLLTYLKLTGLKRGLLINFNVERLVDGIKRVSL